MRVVLDTNVVASGLLWNGTPKHILSAGRANAVQLFTSPPLLLELADVLSRPKFTIKIAAIGLSAIQLVDLYAELAVPVRPTPTPRIVSDPDDDVVVGTAIAANAHSIVTGEKALLLVDGYQGIRIVTASQIFESIVLESFRHG